MLESQKLASFAVLKTLEGRNLTQTLNRIWLENRSLTQQQKGSIQDLSYGVFRHYGFLQAELELLLKTPLKSRSVEALLLVALYQLQHTQAPDHAIVNHAVEGSQKSAKGLVNAVLRNFLRRKGDLLEIVSGNEVARYNHPQWWIDKLKGQYPECYGEILDAGNSRPPMTLRINRRRTALSDYLSTCPEGKSLSDSALMLLKPMPVEKLKGFHEGLVSVQDFGAQRAASLLDLKDGMRVLDACAAPGGKSAHMLEIADIDLLSLDSSETRARQIGENFSRLGLSGIIKVGDAALPGSWWNEKDFDRILADVPCSASGVARRHPDIKWLRRPEDIEGFAFQQERILNALWQTLASGGKLLYSTCSVFAEENSEIVRKFVDRNKAFALIEEQVQLLPNDIHDGFFYALLRKKN